MPYPNSLIPYEIAFVVIIFLIAILQGPKLAAIARLAILFFVPFALGLSVYYLFFDSSTWQVLHDDAPDTQRYIKAARRSSGVYMVMNVTIFIITKLLRISTDGIWYNFISIFVTSLIAYLYDRAVSTDEGLEHFKQNPWQTIFDSYLSFCSPSFMRFLIVLTIDTALMVMLSYYFGEMIPPGCGIVKTVFKKSLIPLAVFTIVGGPLRFAWAYPTVSEGGRVPYLLAYTIAFTILGMITYASGNLALHKFAGILMMILVLAILLQLGGVSNALKLPNVHDDADILPWYVMLILATTVLLSILIIGYRVFRNCLMEYIVPKNNECSSPKIRSKCRGRRFSISRTMRKDIN